MRTRNETVDRVSFLVTELEMQLRFLRLLLCLVPFDRGLMSYTHGLSFVYLLDNRRFAARVCSTHSITGHRNLSGNKTPPKSS